MCVQYILIIEVSPRKVHPILITNGKFRVNPFKKNARVTTFEWSSMCLLSMHKFKLLFFSVLMDMENSMIKFGLIMSIDKICLNSYHEALRVSHNIPQGLHLSHHYCVKLHLSVAFPFLQRTGHQM